MLEIKKVAPQLKPIRSLNIIEEEHTQEHDQQRICNHIQRYYIDKWRAYDEEETKLHDLHNQLMQKEGPIEFSEEEVVHDEEEAQVGQRGSHTARVRVASPQTKILVRILQNWVNRRSTSSGMQDMCFLDQIRGYARGKHTTPPSVKQIRIIAPQNTAQSIVDMILVCRINDHIDTMYERCIPTMWEGARPFTQVLDITHALGMVVERGFDDRSCAAIATMDVRHYYDSVNIPSIIAELRKGSTDRTTNFAQATLRIQNLTSLRIECGPEAFNIPPRARGSLTGSRVAVALARVPLLECLKKLRSKLEPMGFPVSGGKLAIATYVDNMCAVSPIGSGAVAMLNLVEDALKSDWCLDIKDDSREFLVGKASPHTSSDVRYKQVVQMKALGHVISHDGSCQADWQAAKRKMWRAFYGSCASKVAKTLPHKVKDKLLNRAVAPILDYHNSRWAMSPNFASEIDRVQRRMWAILLNIRKSPAETPEGYVRRRARTAGQAACAAGLWSIRTAKHIVAWEGHVGRPANAHSWPAHPMQSRGRKWLQEQRMQHSSLSLQSGRTGTRLLPGKPQTRWHDGLSAPESTCAARKERRTLARHRDVGT